MNGVSSGRVMRQNRCQTEAPSMRAASITSSGRLCSPASRIRYTNGVHCQASMTMMVGIAHATLPVQIGAWTPTRESRYLITPNSPFSM